MTLPRSQIVTGCRLHLLYRLRRHIPPRPRRVLDRPGGAHLAVLVLHQPLTVVGREVAATVISHPLLPSIDRDPVVGAEMIDRVQLSGSQGEPRYVTSTTLLKAVDLVTVVSLLTANI